MSFAPPHFIESIFILFIYCALCAYKGLFAKIVLVWEKYLNSNANDDVMLKKLLNTLLENWPMAIGACLLFIGNVLQNLTIVVVSSLVIGLVIVKEYL